MRKIWLKVGLILSFILLTPLYSLVAVAADDEHAAVAYIYCDSKTGGKELAPLKDSWLYIEMATADPTGKKSADASYYKVRTDENGSFTYREGDKPAMSIVYFMADEQMIMPGCSSGGFVPTAKSNVILSGVDCPLDRLCP